MVWLPVSDASTEIRVVFSQATSMNLQGKVAGQYMTTVREWGRGATWERWASREQRHYLTEIGWGLCILHGVFYPHLSPIPVLLHDIKPNSKFQKEKKEKALPTYLPIFLPKRNIYTIYIYTPRASPNPNHGEPSRAEPDEDPGERGMR